MKLKQLIADLPLEIYKGGRDVEITGLSSHSQFVAPGDLFFAKKGAENYIEEAVATGAVAILTDLPNPFLKETVQVVTPHVQALEGILAARFYGNPSYALSVMGVTGTSGKTTVSYLIKHLFDALSKPCGLIGTIEYIIGDHHFPAALTTPEVIANQKFLKEMVKQKCEAAVMEVSSIGLDRGRVDQIGYDVAIFTNLSPEHLDYHKDMESYAEAKALLFQQIKKGGTGLFNADSPYAEQMMHGCKAAKWTYGLRKGATLYAHELRTSNSGSEFLVTFKNETLPFSWSLIGEHNVYNCLAALGAALSQGISFSALPQIVAAFPTVRGRLERVENSKGLQIYVDYAHKPEALENVLRTLKEIKKGKLITLFGCGGDRDRQKRPLMAKVAQQYSDFVIITSDNPRTEDPQAICQEIVSGLTTEHFLVEVDRKKAIGQGVEMLGRDDCFLIAGKGHETYQIFAHQTIPFDDRSVVQEFANQVTQ